MTILPRARLKFKQIEAHLNSGFEILDFGSGNAGLASILIQNEYKVKSLDIIDNSFFEDINVEIYDGKIIPYEDKTFDLVLAITVLHHTPNPDDLVKELKRVSKRVLIMEDVYTSGLGKFLTHKFDSLVNLEFKGHPHSNKTKKEWEALFKNLNLKIIASSSHRSLGYFRHKTWLLE